MFFAPSSKSLASGKRRKHEGRQVRRRGLFLETLESRALLATFGVSSFGAPTTLGGIVADDFNNDGKADIAVSSFSGPTTYISFGSGTGSLGSFAGVSTGVATGDCFGIASGNLSGTAAPELVASGFSSASYGILANNGSGVFSAANSFNVGFNAEQPVIADMNGDGNNDVVMGVFGGPGLIISYGNGSGGQASFQNVGTGGSVVGITVGDFNGDGRKDIAGAVFGSNSVMIALNQGQTPFPSFTTTSISSGGSTPIAIVSTNLDADSDLDLAVVNRDSGSVTFFSNNGSGGFSAAGSAVTGLGTSFGIDAADFDGDGDKDLAVAANQSSSIRVLRNNGSFSFTAETGISSPPGPFALDVADFNLDGRPDIAVAHSSSSFVSLLLNTSNFAPTNLALSALAVNENAASATTVGNFLTTDNAGNTFTYSLVAGAGSTDNASFTIAGNELRTAASFDFETKSSYSVRVRTIDQGGLSFEKAFTISVNDLNEAPTLISLSALGIAENSASGTVVGTLSTDDADANNTFTYTLVAGEGDSDNNSFAIVGNELQTAAGFDFETKSSYSVRVLSTDQGSLGLEQTFTITVSDLNEAPTLISLSALAVDENAASGTVVGTLSTDDADANNTFTYTLVAGDGDADNGSFMIVGNELQTAAAFDFETKSSYSVRVLSTDQGSLGLEQTFTITVSDLNEAPTLISLSALAVDENAASGTVVGTLSTADADANNTFTYTLVNGDGDADNGSFMIVGNELQTAAGFDFETKSSYSLRVRSTDGGNATIEQIFTINVNALNEAPTDIALSATSIAENQPLGAVVGNFSSTDPDSGNTFTYSLVDGEVANNNGSFEIVGDQLKTKVAFNHEVQPSYTIRVRTTDQNGLSLDKDFTITVTNVNERPTALNLNATAIAENKPIGSVVGNFSSADPDSGSTFTYSLVNGTVANNNGSFQIVGNQLKTKFVLNFEVKPSYNIRVRTTDQTGLSFDKDFTITVANVNERPTALNLSATAVAENKPIGTVVGNFSSADPDSGSTFTYALVNGTVANNNGSFQIVGNQLKTKFIFNHEVKPSYTIRVRTTDQNGLSFDRDFTIRVTNINERPTGLSLSANAVAENKPVGTVVGNFSSADPDSGSAFTYKLVTGSAPNNNGSFTIVGNQLKTRFLFDFEVKPSYTIRVRTTDQNGLSFDKDFTIKVTNVYEGPTVGVLSGSVGYIRNSARVTVFAATSLSGGTLAPTKLRVRITDGASAANRLDLGGNVSTFNNVVRVGTTIVGTLSRGPGTNELMVAFKAGVTRDVVQQVARSITFRTTASATAGTRKVLISVYDGTLFSPEASRLVSVS